MKSYILIVFLLINLIKYSYEVQIAFDNFQIKLTPNGQKFTNDVSNNILLDLNVFDSKYQQDATKTALQIDGTAGLVGSAGFQSRNMKITAIFNKTIINITEKLVQINNKVVIRPQMKNTTPTSQDQIYFSLLQKAAKISIGFFQKILKVIPFNTTIINSKNDIFETSCYAGYLEIPIPNTIKQDKFNDNVDHYIFISFINQQQQIIQNSSGSFYAPYNAIAYANSCNFIFFSDDLIDKLHRPPFSTITYNMYQIRTIFPSTSILTDFESNFKFQDLIRVTLHQTSHAFGLNMHFLSGIGWNLTKGQQFPRNKSYFFANAYSSQRRGVLIKNESANPIIVRVAFSTQINNYLKTYYNCGNTKGAILSNFSNSHWDQISFSGQLMTPTYPQNYQFSKLTLALFQSTGFYASVDNSYAQQMTHLKNKGCAAIDYPYSQGNTAFSEIACNTSFWRNQRCNQGVRQMCYKQQYRDNIIYKWEPIRKSKNTCSLISNSQSCQNNNWCSQQKLCINNKCISTQINSLSINPPSPICSQHCLTCLNDGKCTSCQNNFVLSSNSTKCTPITLPCVASNCKKCINGSQNLCQQCLVGHKLDLISKTCIFIPRSFCLVKNCKNCSQLFCTKCNNSYILDWRNNVCVSLQQVDLLPYCDGILKNCKIYNNNKYVYCFPGYTINSIGFQYCYRQATKQLGSLQLPVPTFLLNKNTLSNENFFINENNASTTSMPITQTVRFGCNLIIQKCETCQFVQKIRYECLSCQNLYYLNQNNQCLFCHHAVPQCKNCQQFMKNNQVYCNECVRGYIVIEGKCVKEIVQ